MIMVAILLHHEKKQRRTMINFKEITLEDKQWIAPLLKASDYEGCHQNFGNLFTWAKINKTYVAKHKDYLVVKVQMGNEAPKYFFPAGSGDIKPVIEDIMKEAMTYDSQTVFIGISPSNIEVLDSLFPNRFEYKEIRGDFDYVYLIENMSNLSGRKFHSMKNHVNAFMKNNEWTFELINKDNIAECKEMSHKWIGNQEEDNQSLDDEFNATKRYLKYFFELELDGALLRVEGKVVAFTIGEVLNSDTYVVHLEKAFKEVRGSYPMMNRQFATWVMNNYPHIKYINREEDIDDEGLRKAKLSYNPYQLNEKFHAILVK